MLASIQRIKKIEPHDNADSLEKIFVLGWQVVDKIDKFKAGDLVVYVQIDTILPEAEWCEFMRDRGWRVRSVKFRKEISQGLIFPIEIMGEYPVWELEEGKDVSEALGVTKYEKPMPACSDAKGSFPVHIISITDEERIQNIPQVIDKITGDIDITLKHDGTSFTYIKECMGTNGEVDEAVCSRRMMLKKPEDGKSSHYWDVYEKYNLNNLPNDIIVQGELCGPSIQGNKQGLKELKLYIFNVFSQVDGWYNQESIRKFCKIYGLDIVKPVYNGPVSELDWSVKGLLKLADDQKYENGSQAEGIVVRPSIDDGGAQRPFSFKVISNKFALKNGE